MYHISMTGSSESLELLDINIHHSVTQTKGTEGFFSKMQFCISALSEAKSNRRGGVRAGKYCTTHTL